MDQQPAPKALLQMIAAIAVVITVSVADVHAESMAYPALMFVAAQNVQMHRLIIVRTQVMMRINNLIIHNTIQVTDQETSKK